MSSVADFFEGHLVSLMTTPLLEGYDHYSIDCDIHFTDRRECWHIDIDQGQLIRIRLMPHETPTASVQFEVTEPIFWKIVNGETSPQMAFFKRQTQIHGDLFQGMKLAKILALFFARYPYPKRLP